ncbi:DUF4238 domain-containing protein [Agrobacterium sp. LAD9]|uniref:DUF4238 domain-containing protein n=1 Tax=Agrobacterium sp. LAD9 TaxID=2055153 RepID=UPI000D1E5163|nr:DUF4238 domain-containing protein [Agrobacterium sp. LAD9]
MTPNRPSKKHHFVPQAQLRHFAADDEQNYIFVFAKDAGHSFRASILNAGSENDFNTVSLGDAKWNFEDLFQEVDTNSARLIGEIVTRLSLAWLTPVDHLALIDLFATQLLRTHFSRTTPKRIAEGMREVIRQVGYDPDQDPDMAMPSDAVLRLGAVKAFLDRGQHVVALGRLVPALYMAAGDHRFLISDHPVSVTNAFPYGGLGLTSQGILVTLPIAPQLAITLHCPTIVHRYELAERADIDDERKMRMLRYRDGLRSGEPIAVDDDAVRTVNFHQIARSARFLYAAKDDFEFAREIVRDHPDFKKVESHVQLGKLGHAPPPRSDMPTGTHLVVFGVADHCMLAIEEIDDAGEGLTARTSQGELLAMVAADPGMLRVELFTDGHFRRSMGEAMIERIGGPKGGWFRVVHRDPSLRALTAHIDAERKR